MISPQLWNFLGSCLCQTHEWVVRMDFASRTLCWVTVGCDLLYSGALPFSPLCPPGLAHRRRQMIENFIDDPTVVLTLFA